MVHSVLRCAALGESVEQIRLDLLIPIGKTVESSREHERQKSRHTSPLPERHGNRASGRERDRDRAA
ncbi:hypothetical protein [Streptomyces sp. NBC_01800]|uniref:hypothetical protein n=1 Tax=Streptomyces sp. NBC_01800 TaxID=2975945 RepID=UPI002DD7E075|nr:hypothetical protein [Streptomyces sp. NBC_01800]WSA72424.1 hypothetical protein OIE65_38940 [Streptomyces sp. NBC_01800]